MLTRFFAKGKTERSEWEARAVWLRVRYTDPHQLRKCLLWLSTATKVGRVALWHQVDAAGAMLHIGLPPNAEPVIMRMAHDYGFSLQVKLDILLLPSVMKLSPLAAADLPWDASFMAHLVGEQTFVAALHKETSTGQYQPEASGKKMKSDQATWKLPEPGRGLSQQPVWTPVGDAIAAMSVTQPDEKKWMLGLSREGKLLQTGGSINLYGGSEETSVWLTHMATQLIRQQPGNLIIIDGCGNLVPQLKRKNSVLRLIGSRLHYMDMDNDLVSSGFNPLAAVPGEPEPDMQARWRAWFTQMGVHRSNLPILAEAYAAGIRELMALVRWLNLPAQQIREPETASLRHRLNAFLRTRIIQEWVDWPDNPFRLLPEGGLLFSCHCQSWERTQMLFSVLLGALNSPDARLILHGIPWQDCQISVPEDRSVFVSNGPVLPEGKQILVRCHKAAAASLLGSHFFPDDAQMQENLHLLGMGEGIVVDQGEPIYTSWGNPA
jgi:hypothetical protein